MGQVRQSGWRTAGEPIRDNALTLSVGQSVNCQWSPNGNLFGSVSFGEVQLTAYVDGYLMGVKKSDIFAIVEVKAGIRDPEQYPLVEWQEGAEMVSWIMNDEENLRHHPFETWVECEYSHIFVLSAVGAS